MLETTKNMRSIFRPVIALAGHKICPHRLLYGKKNLFKIFVCFLMK